MLMDYINKNYQDAEPIFISELPCKSKEALRQEVKKLSDEKKLIRIHNGVYYKPYKTILGTDGKASIYQYIEKKYIEFDGKCSGYYCGIGLFNKNGFTTQVPAVLEIASNKASTSQRKMEVYGYRLIVYKPRIKVCSENVNEIEFLDLMLDIDKYSELKRSEEIKTIKAFIQKKNIDFKKVKEYLPFYPDKIYKNIYERGIMNELV